MSDIPWYFLGFIAFICGYVVGVLHCIYRDYRARSCGARPYVSNLRDCRYGSRRLRGKL